jgi:hypothetical protein
LSQAQVIGHFQAGGGSVHLNEAPVDAYGAAVFGDNPDSYWRFDEATGAVAEDSSLVGQTTGTVGSAVTRVTDNLKFPGTAIQTPGSANNGGVASTSSISGPSAYSAEFWINTTTNRGGKVVGFENVATGNASSYDRQVYMLNNGRLRFGVYTGSVQTVTTTAAVNDGNWHHVVASQDASGMKLYVDGALAAQNSVAGNQAFDGFWRIGGGNLNSWPDRPSSDYISARIDEVAIYGGALPASTVQTHYVLSLQDTVAPTTPTNLAKVGTNSANLAWAASSDANGVAGYRVYRGVTSDFVADPSSLVGDVTTTSWADADTAPGTRFYRVVAYDLTGNVSAPTGALEVVVADTTAPTAVTGLTGSSSETDVTLGWNASTDNVGVDHYRVYRGTTADFSIDGLTPIAQTGSVTYLDSALPEGQWYYRVVAVDAAGNVSALSAPVGVLVDIDTDAPTTPTGLTGSIASDGDVNLAWSASTDDFGVVGYRIFRGTTADFVADETTKIAEGITTTTWSGAAGGVGTWYYRVAAYDGATNQSPASASIAVTVVDTTAPSVPTGVEVAFAGLDAQVSWNASTDNVGVAGYRVYRGATSGFTANDSTLLGTVAQTTFSESGLAAGDHFYRVAAVDTAGNVSAVSASVKGTAVAPDTQAPSVPAGVSAAASGSTAVALSWTASADNVGVTGYSVYRGTTAGFTTDASSKIADVTGLTYADSGLSAGTYFYRVIAKDAAGNTSAASDAVQVTLVEPAGQPVEVVVPIVDDSMAAQIAPTTKYGTSNQLSSRLTAGTIESFLQLNLPAAPAGTVLTQAVLSVRTSTDATAASTEPHKFDLVSGAWDESSIIWTNRPTTAISDVLGTLSAAPAISTAYTVPLNATGLSDYLGSSVTLRMTGTGGDNLRIWSAEATSAAHRPSLKLVFTPVSGPVPTPDTVAPSVPGNVTATASGTSAAVVSWAAATDNVGVAKYALYRGTSSGFVADASSKIADVTGLSYTNSGLAAGTYFYRVIALDAAGNASAASAAVQVTLAATPPATPPTVQTITTVADTMVASNNINGVYGPANQLSSRGTNGTIESFLDFELPAAPAGATLTGVALRLTTSSDATANSVDTHDIVLMAGPWDEATMTWNNRITSTIGGPIGQIAAMPALNTQYSTALSTADIAPLAGQRITMRISSAGADNMRVWSKDVTNANLRPTLILTYSAG